MTLGNHVTKNNVRTQLVYMIYDISFFIKLNTGLAKYVTRW